MKSLFLLLCLLYTVASGTSTVKNKQKMRDPLENLLDKAQFQLDSFQSDFPPANSLSKRGFCDDNKGTEIEPCDGCSIVHKWANEQIVTYDDNDDSDDDFTFEKIVTKIILDFKDNNTLTISTVFTFFLSEQAADHYNEFAEEHDDCSEIDKDKYFLKVTQNIRYSYDFADCDLTYCGPSDTDCWESSESQGELCGLEKIDTDFSINDDCGDLPTVTYNQVEFLKDCSFLDLFPETDGLFFIYKKVIESPTPTPSPSSPFSISPTPSPPSPFSISPTPSPPSPFSISPAPSPSSSSSSFWKYLLFFVVGAIVGCLLVLIVFGVFFWMKRKNEQKYHDGSDLLLNDDEEEY